MKIYNPSREERAFLYQEAQDLEALTKNLGSLSVVVEERADDFRVTFMVAPETLYLRVTATEANMYHAAVSGKTEAVGRLSALVNALPPLPVGLGGEVPGSLLH